MGDDRKRDESGRFEPNNTDEEILEAIQKHEPAATNEIAEELGIARQSADYRLRKLLDQGQISKKKVGNSLVWLR